MRNVILYTALLASAACAGAKSHEPTSKVYGEASDVREGTVASISDDHLTVVDPTRPDGAAVVLNLGNDTTYVEHGDYVHRGDVNEGDQVRVFFNETQGADHALRVEVLSGDEAKQVEQRSE